MDLVDETGGIAAVAGLLAQYHISIKNIGIVNNREFEEGVLQLAFPDKQTLTVPNVCLPTMAIWSRTVNINGFPIKNTGSG